ncbi:sulfotransferase family protein [Pontimicrobium sp. IMCC45349]|uniref:sulfotransferase family protein n=1 Tax=Pontimicrobium sp. IMCC45349 TaxID=3391574 RepID=UPI0039A39516
MQPTLNFICIGAQKSATSTLHDILSQHPDLELPFLKETHFFSDNDKYKKGLESYFLDNFNSFKKKYYGEIDPEYCFFPLAAKRIYDFSPNAKIIFILRNPVDRAYSHYLMTKRIGRESLNFKDAIYKEKERLNDYFGLLHYSYISRGKYLNQIKTYFQLFGEENVKIILFEDFIKDTPSYVKEISSFIGLPTFEYNYKVKSNVASEPKSILIRDFIFKENKLKKYIGKLIPAKKTKDLIMTKLYRLNVKEAKKEPLSNEIKTKIYNDFFKSEINILEQVLNKDLSNWKFD